MADGAFDFIELDGLVNVRDVGGLPVGDGRRVATRRVYRADSLHRLTHDGSDAVAALGIATVIDLRTASEREEQPGPIPSIHVAVQERVTGDEFAFVRAIEGRETAERFLRDLYVALLMSGAPRFGEALTVLSRRGALPAIVHCAGGKDRTGLAIALLLSTLGVERSLVLDEYAAKPGTAIHAARLEEVHATFVAHGVDPDVARGLLSTPRWAMADALTYLDDAHGGVEAYLVGPAGMTDRSLHALRDALVV